MSNYHLWADIGEPPRPICTACTDPAGRVHVVVTKQPRGELSVLCEACALAACASAELMRAVELATTMDMSLPQLAAWMARRGIWEIPLDHESLCWALGVGVGFAKNIWADPR